MKRIDAHQHFWRFRQSEYPWIGPQMAVLRRDFEPPALFPELQREGFDGCIAVQARALEVETDYLLALAAQFPWIEGVIGWVDLMADDLAASLDRWRGQPTLKGFRHALQDEPDAAGLMNDRRFRAGVGTLQAHGHVYEVLIYEHQLDAAVALCKSLDRCWMVVDHLGKPAIRDRNHAGWRRRIFPLRDMPHVVCKLSGLVTEADRAGMVDAAQITPYLDTAMELFGAERLMFGSDWPVCLLSAQYARVCRIVRRWTDALAPAERRAIWGGTAMRVYAGGDAGWT